MVVDRPAGSGDPRADPDPPEDGRPMTTESHRTVLETDRLRLREMAGEDLDFLAALLGDPEVMRFYPRTYSRPDAELWLEVQLQRYESHGFGFWLMVDRDSGCPVGQAGLVPQSIDAVDEIGLAYIVERTHWRRGLAAEASVACLAHAFDELGLERVVCPVRPQNLPSRALAEKLGFRADGRTGYAGYVHVLYAMNREQWRRIRQRPS